MLQLMERLQLSSQVKASDEFTQHNIQTQSYAQSEEEKALAYRVVQKATFLQYRPKYFMI